MNKGYLLLIGLLFGCDVASPQSTGIECIEGECRADITDIFETTSDINAAIRGNDCYVVIFNEDDFREGVGYFTFIAEASRPTLDYRYNNQYWVRASFKTDKEVVIRDEVVTVGQWNARMDVRDVFNKHYGNYGIPPEDKLATRVVIGPIPKAMVEKGTIMKIFMEVEYDTGEIVTDEEKVVLRLY